MPDWLSRGLYAATCCAGLALILELVGAVRLWPRWFSVGPVVFRRSFFGGPPPASRVGDRSCTKSASYRFITPQRCLAAKRIRRFLGTDPETFLVFKTEIVWECGLVHVRARLPVAYLVFAAAALETLTVGAFTMHESVWPRAFALVTWVGAAMMFRHAAHSAPRLTAELLGELNAPLGLFEPLPSWLPTANHNV